MVHIQKKKIKTARIFYTKNLPPFLDGGFFTQWKIYLRNHRFEKPKTKPNLFGYVDATCAFSVYRESQTLPKETFLFQILCFCIPPVLSFVSLFKPSLHNCHEKKHSSDWFELPDELMANIMLFRLEYLADTVWKRNKVSLSI